MVMVWEIQLCLSLPLQSAEACFIIIPSFSVAGERPKKKLLKNYR